MMRMPEQTPGCCAGRHLAAAPEPYGPGGPGTVPTKAGWGGADVTALPRSCFVFNA